MDALSIFHLALDLTGCRSAAEDLVQDALAKTHGCHGGSRGEAPRPAGPYQAVVEAYLGNACCSDAGSAAGGATARPARSTPRLHAAGSDGRAGRRQAQRDIDAALDALSPCERAAFVLCQYRHQKVREAAGAMDVAPRRVKVLLFHAVKKLRAALRRCPDDPLPS